MRHGQTAASVKESKQVRVSDERSVMSSHPANWRDFSSHAVPRIGRFASVFTGLPLLLALLAACRQSSRAALVASVLRAAPGVVCAHLAVAVGASLFMATLLALSSLWAWGEADRGPWLRTLRLVSALWAPAFVLYPGFASWLPGLRGLPWWLVAASVLSAVLAAYALPFARPTRREVTLATIAAVALYVNPPPPSVNLAAVAHRPLGKDDVLLLGFDSLSYSDTSELLNGFTPSRGSKLVYANAWTPIANTSNAWRTIFSGKYPDADALLPGARWPRDGGAWLPRELAARRYVIVMMQDEPATNVFQSDESVSVPHLQGWRSIVQSFAWRAGFPLATALGRPWLALFGGPADNVDRYAYRPEWFRHSALLEMARAARKGPLLWASHSCYVHGPLHLSLSEARQLPSWWKRSPKALEGSGNPFTDASTGGGEDVEQVRVASMRREIARWLKDLDDQQVLGNALVFVLSDHGPRGEWVGRERTEHIQLARFKPGPRVDRVVSDPVSLVDLAPSIRNHVGLPVDAGVGAPLPCTNGLPRSSRRLGRVMAPTLDSAGVRLDQVTAAEISRTLTYNQDGSYSYASSFVRRVAAGTASDPSHILEFVEHAPN